MEEKLRTLVSGAVKEVYGLTETSFVIEHPTDLSLGDYATNIALVISKQLGKNPKDTATELVEKIKENNPSEIETISVAGPGFINFTLSRTYFSSQILEAINDSYGDNTEGKGKRIMVEYTDPNPFKPFHIGHLMTNAIGEAIARILESTGADIIRANYQGDVGRHVAMALYGLKKNGKPEGLNTSEYAKYIGECYVEGNKEYEESEEAKREIDEINKQVYERSNEEINALYDWGRKVTLEAFEVLYKVLGTKFDHYFFESEMAAKGREIVEEYLDKGIFSKSDGAVVFEAQKYNPKLHTRVFITQKNLPTYETKEIGLVMTKFEKENLDQSIVITADEQIGYMTVVTEAIRQIQPEYAQKMTHITHGMMRFASGKMSSRKGNVITGESLLEDAKALALEKMHDREMSEEEKNAIAEHIGVAAIKYTILRQGIGENIVYDEKQSVSFEGDSGPYLQYTITRARSVLAKAASLSISEEVTAVPDHVYDIEKLIYRFPEVVKRSAHELEPHHLSTFLIGIASAFNSFYANEVIADQNDMHAPYKVLVTKAVHTVLSKGLRLLGMPVPEKM